MKAMRWHLLLIAAVLAETGKDDDEIKPGSLPGVPANLDFKQYSGYVNVGGGRNLHYWFVEATSTPEKKPLLLWLNGGPGCSSLLGLLTEHGPFRIDSVDAAAGNAHLHLNPDAWNRYANMIYLESPSPVGFSYGGNRTQGDVQTAQNNYDFLQGFISKFPEYKGREFFVSGESYAGQYVPQLSSKILQENARGVNPFINIKGFMAGNPSGLDTKNWNGSYWSFVRNHALISNEELDQVNPANCGANCPAVEQKIWMQNMYGIDPYNIYAPCLGQGPTSQVEYCATMRDMEALNSLGGVKGYGQSYVPCGDYNVTVSYLNMPATKSALHVSSQAYKWTPCSTHLTYGPSRTDTPELYKQMYQTLHIVVYSGDIDSCVPYLGTMYSIGELGLKETSPWQRWMYTDEHNTTQIGGYVVKYSGISYATIRGAGHMVPQDRPKPALELIRKFLTKEW